MSSVTRRSRRLPALAVALLVGLALAAPAGTTAGATDRYVAPGGSDGAAGTLDAPWRTLAKGLASVSAGQTLWVRGGTYDEDLSPTLHDGSAAARITVRGYPGERATVKGLVRFNDPDYWTISDLAFTWGGGTFDDHMVKVHGGTGWIMERLDIYGSQSRAGLLIARSSSAGAPHDYVLRDSVIHDSANASNLYLNPGLDATGGLIEHNLFFNSPTENAKIGWGGTDVAAHRDEFGAAGVTFRYNTLYHAAQPLTIAEPAANVDAYGNLIVAGTKGYLVRLDGVEGQLGSGIRVHDNLGDGASRWCEDFDATPSCGSVNSANVFPRDPLFDSTASTGFHPRDSVAAAYGRWAAVAGGGPVVGPTPAASPTPTPEPTPAVSPTTTAEPAPKATPTAKSTKALKGKGNGRGHGQGPKPKRTPKG